MPNCSHLFVLLPSVYGVFSPSLGQFCHLFVERLLHCRYLLSICPTQYYLMHLSERCALAQKILCALLFFCLCLLTWACCRLAHKSSHANRPRLTPSAQGPAHITAAVSTSTAVIELSNRCGRHYCMSNPAPSTRTFQFFR